MLDKIKDDMKVAMKAKEQATLSTLRMLLAKAKDTRIEKGEDLTDEEMVSVVQSCIKSRRQSVEMFEQGARPELVEKEQNEIKILEQYLPQQMTEAEIEGLVDQAIADTGASTKRDMGKVMGAIMGKYKGQVDGKVVQQIAAGKLA